MNLTLTLTPDEGAKLRAAARVQGTTPEGLVRKALAPIFSTAAEEQSRKAGSRRLNLPQMKGAVIGSLSRRDIYNERG
jgi:hypothetical protein